MSNSDILSRLTLKCLTYNRHEFIRRQIVCFYDCPVNLRFMDSSKTSIKLDDTNLKTGQLKWNYQHFPDLNYYERLLLASEEVETEFICLLPDDDILFKTGLETAINNLDNCKNLQFGGGKVARIIYAYKVSEQIKRYFNLYILIFKLNAHKNFKILILFSF